MLLAAKTAGYAHLNIDGTLIESESLSTARLPVGHRSYLSTRSAISPW